MEHSNSLIKAMKYVLLKKELNVYKLNLVIIFFKGGVFILPAGIHIFVNLL